MAISSGLAGAVGAVPIGSVTAFAGATAPSGWLLCAGQTVSRTQYSGLFLTIGTTYGAGDGSTTFALPDFRGRVIAGKDDMGGTAANRLTAGGSGITGTTLGATGGAETHTLTTAQMPSHNHTQSAHQHGLNVARNIANAYLDTGNYWAGGTSLNNEGYARTDFPGGVTMYQSYLTAEAPAIQSAGGSGAHNNTQPTIVLNYIIKAQ